MPDDVFRFRFDARYRALALPFGITPSSAAVVVGDDAVTIAFGPWRLRTPVDNIAELIATGPYSLVKTAGPAHLSLRDRGVTFATNPDRGLCLSFHDPVPAIEPTGRLRHPGATVTVADVEGLEQAIRQRASVAVA